MHFRWNLGKQTVIVFLICLGLIVFCNVYFLFVHTKSQNSSDGLIAKSTTDNPWAMVMSAPNRNWSIQARLERRWTKVLFEDLLDGGSEFQANHAPPPPPPPLRSRSLPDAGTGLPDVWEEARMWVGSRQVYPSLAEELSAVLHAMSTRPILRAGIGKGGTQLKLTLTLAGGQEVIFKPMRYERNTVFTEAPFAGADRHNGEIAAFHLSRLLDLRWVPPAVGRKVNLRTEVLPVTNESLRRTFLTRDNNLCFYGVCHYCTRKDPACAKGDVMEGAVILYLPSEFSLKTYMHPWRRTYSKKEEVWKRFDDYCERVKVRYESTYTEGPRLMDIIDISVFDFLIGNADRHHYETFKRFNDSIIIMLDNGKSFGNPSKDEATILAPLYQCCVIRKSTWEKLKGFPNRSLSMLLSSLLEEDPLTNVLTEEHLRAIDRRRLKVLDVVDFCLEKRGLPFAEVVIG